MKLKKTNSKTPGILRTPNIEGIFLKFIVRLSFLVFLDEDTVFSLECIFCIDLVKLTLMHNTYYSVPSMTEKNNKKHMFGLHTYYFV